MPSRALLVFVALVPVVAVTVAYLLGIRHEILPRCIPFIDGCTSISATGRYAPGSYVFKPVFLLQSLLLLVIWFRLSRYLERQPGGAYSRHARVIVAAALLASLALVIYTLTLGSKIPLYEFMRRFGIYFYFIGTVACQIAATLAIRRLLPSGHPAAGAMTMLVMAPFALGLANFLLKASLDDADAWENRIEWCVALLMQVWFLVLAMATRRLPASAKPAL